MNLNLIAAGLLGATAVALGAYAAHGLEGAIAGLGYSGEELAHRVENFETGARYQLSVAVALLAIGYLKPSNSLRAAAILFVAGSVVFSGLLYALAFVGEGGRWLGAIVPLGGLSMIAAWALLAVVGFFGKNQASPGQEATTSMGQEKLELTRLEEILTHQQQLIQQLDAIVTETRRDADKTVLRITRLEEAARRLYESQRSAENLPDERPPHY